MVVVGSPEEVVVDLLKGLLANPSGVLPVDALVEAEQGGPVARSVTAYRTARALMEGHVLVPGA